MAINTWDLIIVDGAYADSFKKYIVKKGNSLLKLIKINKAGTFTYIFSSNYKPKQAITIRFVYLDFNDVINSRDLILSFVKNAYINACSFSIENMPKYSDVIQEELYSVILRAFAWPDCNSKNNIISLVAKLFFNLIIGHFLKNGNKRFATSLMFYILYYFGYHFKWSTGEKKNYKEVEEKVIGFVQEWENRDRKISQSLSETMIKEKISEWIKKNIVIAIHK